jgi:hypothetical protein
VSKTIYNEPLLLKWSFCGVEVKVVNDWINLFFREKITAITGFGRFFREKLFSNFQN